MRYAPVEALVEDVHDEAETLFSGQELRMRNDGAARDENGCHDARREGRGWIRRGTPRGCCWWRARRMPDTTTFSFGAAAVTPGGSVVSAAVQHPVIRGGQEVAQHTVPPRTVPPRKPHRSTIFRRKNAALQASTTGMTKSMSDWLQQPLAYQQLSSPQSAEGDNVYYKYENVSSRVTRIIYRDTVNIYFEVLHNIYIFI